MTDDARMKDAMAAGRKAARELETKLATNSSLKAAVDAGLSAALEAYDHGKRYAQRDLTPLERRMLKHASTPGVLWTRPQTALERKAFERLTALELCREVDPGSQYGSAYKATLAGEEMARHIERVRLGIA